MIASEPNGAIAVFATTASAHRALEALSASGFDMKGVSPLLEIASAISDGGFAPKPRRGIRSRRLSDALSVFGPGHTNEVLAPELDHSPQHGGDVARFWAVWGAVVGAAAGGAAISVPVLVAVVGLGPFAPIMAAIAVSATTLGALTSALVGYGVHEAHARRYEEALRDGKTVVVAHTDDLGRLEDARTCLASASPEHIDVHGLRALGAS